jgi:hypothetical protein
MAPTGGESRDSFLGEFDGEELKRLMQVPHSSPSRGTHSLRRHFSRPERLTDDAAAVSPAAADLTAYRRRAAEKLAQMHERERAADFDRIAELGILRVWLADLLDDLKSVGAAEADTKAMLALMEKLAGDLNDAIKLWQEALDVLQAFAEGVAPKKGRKRQGFWK